jgi:hypothetical protein
VLQQQLGGRHDGWWLAAALSAEPRGAAEEAEDGAQP